VSFRSVAERDRLVAYRDYVIAVLSDAKPDGNRPFYSALVHEVVEIFCAVPGAHQDRLPLMEIPEVCLRQRPLEDPRPAFEIAIEETAMRPSPEVLRLFVQCPQVVTPEHLRGIARSTRRASASA
jgi:hypothetical protein